MVAMTTMSTRQQRQGVTSPVAIELRSVHKHFGQVRAVRGIDLAIAPGEIVALLGPNGAGKTTTIDMILGLSQPTDGQVSVYGMHPRQAIERGLISAVLQTGGLLKDLTVAETARYTASLFAGSRRWTRFCGGPASATSRTGGSASAQEASSSDCGSPWRCCPIPSC